MKPHAALVARLRRIHLPLWVDPFGAVCRSCTCCRERWRGIPTRGGYVREYSL